MGRDDPEPPEPGRRYFAYGSNLDVGQMASRGLEVSGARPAVLDGYRLGFTIKADERWHGGAADIVPEDGSAVEGVVYDLAGDIETMDPWEGVPTSYRRFPAVVRITATGERVGCWTYEVVDKLSYQPPSPGYIGKMILAAQKHGLSDSHVRMLRFHLACSLMEFGEHATLLGALVSRVSPVSIEELARELSTDGQRILEHLQELAEWGWVVRSEGDWSVPEDMLQDATRMVAGL
jgi:biotin operon repressor